jgi:hypothetical protein
MLDLVMSFRPYSDMSKSKSKRRTNLLRWHMKIGLHFFKDLRLCKVFECTMYGFVDVARRVVLFGENLVERPSSWSLLEVTIDILRKPFL